MQSPVRTITWEELCFETLFRHCIVWFKLNSHVVVLGGDSLWFLCTTELPMEPWISRKPAAHLHVVILTNLCRETEHVKQLGSCIWFWLQRRGSLWLLWIWRRGAMMQWQRESTEQTHPAPIQNNPSAHVIALSLKDVKEQGDAVLCGGNQLPDAVLVRGILSGPAGARDRPIQLGDEASTGSWTGHKT